MFICAFVTACPPQRLAQRAPYPRDDPKRDVDGPPLCTHSSRRGSLVREATAGSACVVSVKIDPKRDADGPPLWCSLVREATAGSACVASVRDDPKRGVDGPQLCTRSSRRGSLLVLEATAVSACVASVRDDSK